jgi:hypothetical protein
MLTKKHESESSFVREQVTLLQYLSFLLSSGAAGIGAVASYHNDDPVAWFSILLWAASGIAFVALSRR